MSALRLASCSAHCSPCRQTAGSRKLPLQRLQQGLVVSAQVTCQSSSNSQREDHYLLSSGQGSRRRVCHHTAGTTGANSEWPFRAQPRPQMPGGLRSVGRRGHRGRWGECWPSTELTQKMGRNSGRIFPSLNPNSTDNPELQGVSLPTRKQEWPLLPGHPRPTSSTGCRGALGDKAACSSDFWIMLAQPTRTCSPKGHSVLTTALCMCGVAHAHDHGGGVSKHLCKTLSWTGSSSPGQHGSAPSLSILPPSQGPSTPSQASVQGSTRSPHLPSSCPVLFSASVSPSRTEVHPQQPPWSLGLHL